MTEERKDQMPDPASLLRGMTSRRMSRRNLIKYAGVTAGGLSLASILAACGGNGDGNGGEPGEVPEPGEGPTVDFAAAPGPVVNFANWPLYVDKAREDGQVYYPSMREFENETGLTVNYQEVINDNAGFFAELLPQLQAGQDTGWDIIVITNGWEFTLLTQNGFVLELDPDRRPNFDANAAAWAKDPDFDPGNRFSMTWQSGLTGLGWNNDLVSRPLTSMDDLMNPDVVGSNSVGMLKADMPDLVMINLGIDPKTSGPEEWQEAADWLLMQRESGTVRRYYDQGWVDDFTAGNLSAASAWSGDVLYYKIWEGYNFDFAVPEGGALLWVDNMLIPAGSSNPQGAYQLMDYVYKPEIAQMITEWVLYMSPVPEVQELIRQHAEEARREDVQQALADTAENPNLWPDDALLANVSTGRQLTSDDEKSEWDAIFLPISES
jgi:spermidine/putrescine transport system substrate-binding protein